jgi:hypothetical protein
LLPDYRTADLAIHALYPTARNISLKARRFIEHLVASFGEEPPWDAALGDSISNPRLHKS